MKIDLSKPFAADSAVDEYDVRQIKKALNRLGYYQPQEKTGITGIADAAMFRALKSFQKDQGLNPTGMTKPGDATIEKINNELASKKTGKYIWRTVGDGKVRKNHAELDGTVRDFADSPDPGDEFNCRCWAEPVSANCEQLKIDLENARLQAKSEYKSFLSESQRAEILKTRLEDLWDGIVDEAKKAGFEIAASLLPGLDGRLPVISAVLQMTQSGTRMWLSCKEYLNTWNELALTLESQSFYERRIKEAEDNITALSEKVQILLCKTSI